MHTWRCRRTPTIVGIGVLALGISLSGEILISHGATESAAGSAILMHADIGDSDATVEENRALKSNVFVGRVVASDGEIDVGIEDPFLVPIYAVDVETSLKGQAQGRVRVSVTSSGSPEDLGGDEVVVGDRYLFAGEGPAQGLYWIDEGLGSLRIADDEEARAVIAQYQQLIIQMAQTPPVEPEINPCDVQDANPKIDIDPNEGKAGRTVQVTVNRVSSPVVFVYWRNRHNRAGREEVHADCSARLQIKIPHDARPGRYDIIVVDSRGEEARERFHVVD